jgi:histidine triad (HIT) family protein
VHAPEHGVVFHHDHAGNNHAPDGYACPFCTVVSGGENPIPYTGQSDVVLRTGKATAFISSGWWPNNPGHVLVVPDAHVENLYSIRWSRA